MVNPNKKVKRPDGLGKIFKYKTSEDGEEIFTLPIIKTLNDNYIYLLRAIRAENYYIPENDSCFFFKEIVYDNEVVGFAAYRPSNINESSLIMQYMYVLDEYRNKGLLAEELDEATTLFESSILIEYPSCDTVKTLIKHRLARVFNDRFAISRIPFYVPMVDIDDATSGVLREGYEYPEKVYSKLSLVYDLELCCVVGVASDNIENMYKEGVADEETINNYNIMSLALAEDDAKYGCVEKRQNDEDIANGTYFAKLKDLLDENDSVIENWLTLM